ncbi:MAG: trigger factor [Chitinophagaceae bacterium]
MATITRENIGLLNDKVRVTVEEKDYLPRFQKSLKSYSKAANLPGFRKGMVPAGLIKKMHGPSIFNEEVIRSVETELGHYLETNKLDIFAQPLALEDQAPNLDMNQTVAYSFDFEIGLRPHFEIPVVQEKTRVEKYRVLVTDKDVEEEMDRLRLKGGKLTQQESITSIDQVVEVNFQECDGDSNPIEGGISRDNSLLVKFFSDSLQKQLVGKIPGDSLVFQLNTAIEPNKLPAMLNDLELKGDPETEAQKKFRLTISKVSSLEKRALDPEFFLEVYADPGIQTEEAFRERIKTDIQKYYNDQCTNRLHNDIFELLVHQTPIDLPEKFLTRWIQVGSEKPKTAEEAAEEYPSFEHQLRWTLISEKLIKQNEEATRISPEEVKEYARKQLQGYLGNTPIGGGENSFMDGYLDRMLQDKKYLEQTYGKLQSEKLFTWLETHLTIEEKELSAEEFSKLPNKHHHHE